MIKEFLKRAKNRKNHDYKIRNN